MANIFDEINSNNIQVFKILLKNNIIKHNHLLNEHKELKLLNKITNNEKKFKYYKY